jgi:hypothetical protein
MSLISATTPFDAVGLDTRSKGSSRLAKRLCDASHFLRNLRVHMRFGELTRAPLRLLRFQLSEDLVECDWVAREPDAWDADLPGRVGERHASLQALEDAIDVRNLLFHTLSGVDTASLRVYRSGPSDDELIITGISERSDRHARSVRSLAMRAQLLGFRFSMNDGVLNELSVDTQLSVRT